MDELQTITDYSKSNPALNSAFTNFTSYYYWSATTNAYDSVYAWIVSAYYGNAYGSRKSDDNYVRCVRGGQSSDSFVNLLFKNASSVASTPYSSLSSGWYLLGATTTKTVGELKTANQNISIMWKYKDGKWQTTYGGTLPNGVTSMSDVKAGEGFWMLIK